MKTWTAGVSGLVFGFGLLLSGMADPAKVMGFLDLAGAWDPSLMLVMGGAIAVAAPTFFWLRRRESSLLGLPLELPQTRAPVTGRLVGGSVLFGIGWGLAGLCPGPALVALGQGRTEALVFVAAMAVGMFGFEWLEGRSSAQAAPASGR